MKLPIAGGVVALNIRHQPMLVIPPPYCQHLLVCVCVCVCARARARRGAGRGGGEGLGHVVA